ncbi:antibiotic biosynthesis monooxygenase [Paraburkholderia ginsengiterrae]|uniref:Antibiotic biosynthesis monooxygenase n=1 Tax=Paraburkholderia ginsengiterrae TaxID=1462993 RepID=A0A1A9N125_9BURK|nr:putative quinol monooxygenase [Paraburkholderia ginsengiterrae]OAJ53708.1 antibiotic biosynthesis monooxygenase [Paraburkholderia ginsengiterrae]OAJ54710.1 antibiotic biosynthesis monooxygenase [Paraburkholderia ginsengiterrae]
MAEAYLQVIAHYFVKPGNGDAIVKPLTELAAATRAEPKNLYYELFRSPLDPDHFVILEQYSSADGLAEHRETEHFQHLGFGTIIPLLDRREVASHMFPGDAA